MKRVGVLSRTVVALACAGLLIPAPVRAQATAARAEARPEAAVAISDVQLQADGTLQGQVVDSAGLPRAATAVQVRQNGRVVAATETNLNGRFSVSSLRGGVYEIATLHGVSLYRVWAHQTAPPSATPAVLVAESDQAVHRAQNRGVLAFLTNPWVLGGIVAAAIAIPLALDDDDGS